MQFRVGILGATGAVGQRFIQLLEDHPWFTVTALAASERSAGRTYGDVVNWMGRTPLPQRIAAMTVSACTPDLPCDFVFSGLDAAAAEDIEPAFARAGYPVISNARNFRMAPDVPLLIPEVNPDHTALIDGQQWGDSPGGGFIVTNPNCSTVGLVMALKPLHDAFGVEAVIVTTLQALSGAGYPGVPSLDILGNVIPHIGGEEDKLETEPNKLLGRLGPDGVAYAGIALSASVNRVAVVDGHLESVAVRLTGSPSPEDVTKAFRDWRAPAAVAGLPSSPERPLVVFDEPAFPQPARHVDLGAGMTASVGKVRPCPVMGIKFNVLSHNTIRGAAGGAILNAELLASEGRLVRRV